VDTTSHQVIDSGLASRLQTTIAEMSAGHDLTLIRHLYDSTWKTADRAEDRLTMLHRHRNTPGRNTFDAETQRLLKVIATDVTAFLVCVSLVLATGQPEEGVRVSVGAFLLVHVMNLVSLLLRGAI